MARIKQTPKKCIKNKTFKKTLVINVLRKVFKINIKPALFIG